MGILRKDDLQEVAQKRRGRRKVFLRGEIVVFTQMAIHGETDDKENIRPAEHGSWPNFGNSFLVSNDERTDL